MPVPTEKEKEKEGEKLARAMTKYNIRAPVDSIPRNPAHASSLL